MRLERSRLLSGATGVLLGLLALHPFNAAGAAPGAGEEDLFASLEAIDQMSLAELLAADTGVASVTPQSQRSSPGILTIVNRDEILASGARDLVDLLRRVPGFGFGTDVNGVIGVGFRGMWGHEGKVLLLVDGHEMNEGMYLTTQFGNHLPVDQIEKIEIIRGPGSAVYGGAAELAVINVVTRSGKALDGGAGSLGYGHMDGGFARRTLSLAWGDSFERLGGLEVSASGFVGQSRLSGLPYSDLAGQSYSMRTDSGTEPAYLNLKAAWQGLKLSFIYDGYQLVDRSAYGENLPKATRVGFPGYYFGARYQFTPLPELTITPRLRYKRQMPWRVTDSDEVVREATYYNKVFERLDASVTASWKALEGVNVVGGAQAHFDTATLQGEMVGLNAPFGDATSVSYRNLAAFLQGNWDNPWVNLTLGARLENHSAIGTSFVPRVGLTRMFGDLHLKALFSSAFKAPGIENLRLNPDIRPEKTQVIELEAGYLFTDNLYATVNVFDMILDGPIVYGFDPVSGQESYDNYEKAGTAGAEAVLRFKNALGSASLGYAYYHAGKNEVPVYAVPDEPNTLLGFASHKVTASGAVEILPRLSVAPSLVFLSGRYGYGGVGADGAPVLERADPAWLLDLYVSYRPAPLDGVTLGAGVYNLLDQRFVYLQPYDGGHPPLPGMGREVALRLAYEH